MNRSGGFTLLELMVTVAVAGVLVTVAIPAWQGMVQRNTMTSVINDLVGDINYARSEAITRGSPVSVCMSDNQSTCSGTKWLNGWIVYAPTDPSGNNLLRAHGAVTTPTITTSKNTVGDIITFGGSGFADKGAGTVSLSSSTTDAQNMTCIVISLSGRVRTETGYYGNGTKSCSPEDENST